MQQFHSHAPAASASAPAPAIVDADKLAGSLVETMTALLGIVEQETELIRAGKVHEASALTQHKSELSQRYMQTIEYLKRNEETLRQSSPDLLSALRHHHDAFRAMLQVNLTVLATAHAVSEGIVRGVNGEMQRKSAPQTYTAYGQHSAPSTRQMAPLAVSRVL
jgi:hypothetical protein